jgi:uncharacterized protein YutE (UPF0331/DUF86 family)
MVDRARLEQMLSNLRAYAGVLEQLARVPEPDFLASPDKIGNAKYHFVIAIECCIDVANHIIASEDLRFPHDNTDSFVVLVEHGILDEALREPLRVMAKFRNRLVHLYWDVDDRRVGIYLRESLGDFDRFARAIADRFRE